MSKTKYKHERNIILCLLSKRDMTIDEIKAETEIDYNFVKKIINILIEEKLIIIECLRGAYLNDNEELYYKKVYSIVKKIS